MTKARSVKATSTQGPSVDLVRKAVEVKIAPSGNAYVSPGVAAMSPKDVYRLVSEKVASKKSE